MKKIISYFLKITNIILLSLLISCSPNIKLNSKVDAKIEIALMLPLSGEHANQGYRLEKIIRKGFEDNINPNIKIKTYDTSNQIELSKSLNNILVKSNKIIIGPLFSEESKFVANRVKNTNNIMISLSNDPSLAGDNIFVYGHAPKRQSQRMVEYFINQGAENFLILFPASPYYLNLNQELQHFIVSNNATLIRSEFYSADKESISNSINNLALTVDGLNEDHLNKKKPVILIIEDNKTDKYLFETIKSRDLDKKSEIIGDWRINTYLASNINYNFTSAASIANSQILHELQSLVNDEYLTPIEFIAYDLGAIINKSIDQEYSKELFISNLTKPAGFENLVGGKVKFNQNIAIRPYDIIKYNNHVYEVLEEAK